MSHWVMLSLKIKNPNKELLKMALQYIAKQYLKVDRVVENYMVRGWSGREQCDFAIPMRLPYGNGYGVKIDQNGEVKVVVDDHGAPLSAQQFAQLLTQTYVTLATAQALQELGYNISNVQETPEGIVLEAVSY